MKRRATRVADLLNPAATLLPAANVIMQLSLPGVGYGVLESPVDSGNVYKHPFKRARTTGTYLAVATIGTESDRALIRDAVDTAHRQVRSTSSSPVSYNAFDPKLQLWVAACLYRYFVDQHEFLLRPARRRDRRRGLSRRQAAGHHAASARADVAAGPGRVRRLLEALARGAAHRPAGPRASARGGVDGVPAVAAASAGRTVQPVRDDGVLGPGVPVDDAARLVGAPAAPVRVAAVRPAAWPIG